ncbi:MAG: hypothetical protein H6881_07220 [Rhodobiaceae bacterium]|nr:hypothetical protein [Rhodobiaceae bacterium]
MMTLLPIALHHGSLDVGQRRGVEAAMAVGSCASRIRGTSTLDLGISTGATSIRSSGVGALRARAGCTRIGRAPTIGSTSRRAPCWYRRTASR